MFWVLLAIGAVVASELLLRLPMVPEFSRVQSASRKATRLLRSSAISDHWKEKILPVYALRIGRGSLLLFGMLCVVISPVILLGVFADGGIASFVEGLMTPVAIVAMIIVSIVYIFLRRKVARV